MPRGLPPRVRPLLRCSRTCPAAHTTTIKEDDFGCSWSQAFGKQDCERWIASNGTSFRVAAHRNRPFSARRWLCADTRRIESQLYSRFGAAGHQERHNIVGNGTRKKREIDKRLLLLLLWILWLLFVVVADDLRVSERESELNSSAWQQLFCSRTHFVNLNHQLLQIAQRHSNFASFN